MTCSSESPAIRQAVVRTASATVTAFLLWCIIAPRIDQRWPNPSQLGQTRPKTVTSRQNRPVLPNNHRLLPPSHIDASRHDFQPSWFTEHHTEQCSAYMLCRLTHVPSAAPAATLALMGQTHAAAASHRGIELRVYAYIRTRHLVVCIESSIARAIRHERTAVMRVCASKKVDLSAHLALSVDGECITKLV